MLFIISNFYIQYVQTCGDHPLFQGSMELVDRLSMREVKKLVDVVSCLVFSDNTHAAMQDELMILVRKQLCHTHSK